MTRHDVVDAAFSLFVVLLLAVVLVAAAEAKPQATPAADSCRRADRTIVVDLDNTRHISILRHAWAAISDGQPERLHVARDLADRHRREALRGIPTKPGFDRDEYAPAFSREGGRGASVRYIRSSVNRSAGAVMGNQLEDYCDGQRFRLERRPRR